MYYIILPYFLSIFFLFIILWRKPSSIELLFQAAVSHTATHKVMCIAVMHTCIAYMLKQQGIYKNWSYHVAITYQLHDDTQLNMIIHKSVYCSELMCIPCSYEETVAGSYKEGSGAVFGNYHDELGIW